MAREAEREKERAAREAEVRAAREQHEGLRGEVAALRRQQQAGVAEAEAARLQLDGERAALDLARLRLTQVEMAAARAQVEAVLFGSDDARAEAGGGPRHSLGSGQMPEVVAEAEATLSRLLTPEAAAGAATRDAAEKRCAALEVELGVTRRVLLEARQAGEAQQREAARAGAAASALETRCAEQMHGLQRLRESEDWLRGRNAVLQAALEEPIATACMLSVAAPMSPGARPMRLVPRTPMELDRSRASHAPSSAGAFGTPVIDGMMQASLEKRARSVAALL